MILMVVILLLMVALQRLVELMIAERNKQWIIKNGGYEVGRSHYRYLVLMHSSFLLFLVLEVIIFQKELAPWWYVPFSLFMIAQAGRVWAIHSLGEFWNTRIMILPGAKVITKGPYQFIRHPNYVVVMLEILALPLIFQAYWTAALFTILNGLILSKRIKMEEMALRNHTNYEEVFSERKRFIPTTDSLEND
ncbi:hypothetical protein BTS2_2466 [Bacillus sp. TS-2]|nr:hypothetical protein BTS2_2466 [Bacillus sp. TS-2]